MVVSDLEKVVIIGQCYGFIHGEFSVNELYDFIISHDFKFRSTGVSMRELGHYLGRSKKFRRVKKVNNVSYFEALDKKLK